MLTNKHSEVETVRVLTFAETQIEHKRRGKKYMREERRKKMLGNPKMEKRVEKPLYAVP